MKETIIYALQVQLDRLKRDKNNTKDIPAWMVVKINDEISNIETLLNDRSWLIVKEF